MNPRVATILSLLLVLLALTAYSVLMPIAAVDPLGSRYAVEYVLGKAPTGGRPEVREVILNGSPVATVTVTFYKRAPPNQNIRVTVELYDDNGNLVGSGTDCRSYSGSGIRTVTVPISPNPQPSQVARVVTSLQVVAICI